MDCQIASTGQEGKLVDVFTRGSSFDILIQYYKVKKSDLIQYYKVE